MPALTCAEAIARVDAIVPVLVDNVRLAIEVKETLEEGNRIVPPGLRSRPTHGLGGYNVIHRSLTYNLALDLARIYDVSAGRELDRQDKASIPVLAHLLAKPDVRASLVARAREWTPIFQDEQARRCEEQLMRVAELCKGQPITAAQRKSKGCATSARCVLRIHCSAKNQTPSQPTQTFSAYSR